MLPRIITRSFLHITWVPNIWVPTTAFSYVFAINKLPNRLHKKNFPLHFFPLSIKSTALQFLFFAHHLHSWWHWMMLKILMSYLNRFMSLFVSTYLITRFLILGFLETMLRNFLFLPNKWYHQNQSFGVKNSLIGDIFNGLLNQLKFGSNYLMKNTRIFKYKTLIMTIRYKIFSSSKKWYSYYLLGTLVLQLIVPFLNVVLGFLCFSADKRPSIHNVKDIKYHIVVFHQNGFIGFLFLAVNFNNPTNCVSTFLL